ncbi:MAG: SDR family NAD(P)-dependent oxidoreductase [Candidatus Dormibacteria bacterium]
MRVVITGGSGGIGSAASAMLRERGAQVLGIDREGDGGVVIGDVRSAAEVERAVSECAARLGGIDVLVNSAGVGVPGSTGLPPDDDARDCMEVNFFGAWNATAAALPHLLRAHGHVVNVASGLAMVDLPQAAAYGGSKRALEAYSNALRLEHLGRVTVTTVFPGYVRTRIHDRSLAMGVHLERLTHEESLGAAAEGIFRACTERPERLALTARSTFEFWMARHFPRVVRAVMAARLRREEREHGTVAARPEVGL